MKKQLVLGTLIAAIAFVGYASLASVSAEAADETPCVRKKFKTKLIGTACKTGQNAAKAEMKKFVKAVKAAKAADGEKLDLTCNSCHQKLKPDYPLEKNGVADLEKYSKYLAGKKK